MNRRKCRKRCFGKYPICLSCEFLKRKVRIVEKNKYFIEGMIKKIDLEKGIINIVSDDRVTLKTDSDSSGKKYNVWVREDENQLSKKKVWVEEEGSELPKKVVWVREDKSELAKEAILLKSSVDIKYSEVKTEEIKSTLIQIALENKKAKFYISKNDKADYKLCNLVISNEK